VAEDDPSWLSRLAASRRLPLYAVLAHAWPAGAEVRRRSVTGALVWRPLTSLDVCFLGYRDGALTEMARPQQTIDLPWQVGPGGM